LFNQITKGGRDFEMNTSKLCCHWCKIPLGNATQVTYLNGNLPICDLCLSASAFADKDKRIAELEAQVEKLKCCGNCINYIYDMEEDHHYCNKNIFHGKRHAGICSNNWQSDTMAREERNDNHS
jgi:hypothetical protein